MFGLLLNNLVLARNETDLATNLAGFAIFSMFFMFLFILIITILIGIYVYSSFAFMVIAKRAGRSDGAIAWIPFIGKPLLASKIAKMHWWPILFCLSLLFIPILFLLKDLFIIFSVFLVFAIISCLVAFNVFYVIWRWKMFEAVGRAGWWILLIFIPQVGGIIYLVLIGIAAWGK